MEAIRKKNSIFSGLILIVSVILVSMPSLAWGQVQPTFDELVNKGVNLLDQGKYAEALESFDQALEIDGEHIDALYFKGETLFWQEQYDEAINYFDQVLAIDQNDVHALYFTSKSLTFIGQMDDAETYFQKAIEIDPGIVDELNQMLGIGFSYVVHSGGKPAISIFTDKVRYVTGQFVTISGFVYDTQGVPANARVSLEISLEGEQGSMYQQSTFSVVGSFFDSGINIEKPGQYKITATTIIDKVEEKAVSLFEVKNIFLTTAAMISYVGLFAFMGLIVIILMRITQKPSIREILRFVCITIIASTPVSVFVLTDVEIGSNSPVGLVIKPSYQEDVTQESYLENFTLPESQEWVINLGGHRNYGGPDAFSTGIQIPIFVLILGIAGGYIRYLHTTYKEIKKESILVRIPKQDNVEEIHVVQIAVLHQSIKDLALLFLAPLLAIAAYFLLLQGGIDVKDFPTIAAVSFAVGLTTDNIISRLEDLLGKKSEKLEKK